MGFADGCAVREGGSEDHEQCARRAWKFPHDRASSCPNYRYDAYPVLHATLKHGVRMIADTSH
jgi:hypothetical protein